MSCIEYKDYTEQYRLLEKLGSGNCATVMRVEDRRTKKAYALKYAKFDSPAKLAVAFQEIEVVRAVDHDTAIKVYYYFIKNTNITLREIQLGIIMELADRSLEQEIFIRRKKNRYFNLGQIEELVITMLEFFAHCQSRGYLHRDIKPSNILLTRLDDLGQDNNNCVKYKVCDFGFAIREHEFSDKNIAGTAIYASPKIQNKFKNSTLFVLGNNYKDDVYSLGITLLQACTLESVELVTPQKLLQKVNARFGLKLTALLQLMLQFDEDKRSDFVQLLKLLHLFLTVKKQGSITLKSPNPSIQNDNLSSQVSIYHKFLGVNQPHTAASDNCEDTKSEEIDKKFPNQIFSNSMQFLGSLKKQDQQYVFKDECPRTINKNLLRNRAQKLPYPQFQSQHNIIQQDKIRTKRRSKISQNQNKFKQLAYGMLGNQLSDNSTREEQIVILKQPNSDLNIMKELKLLYKFPCSMKFIEAIQIKRKQICTHFDALICVAFESYLFVGVKRGLTFKTNEIKMQDISSKVLSLKYTQDTNRIILVLQQNLIVSLNVEKLVNMLLSTSQFIPLQQIVASRWQTLTNNLCQVINDEHDQLTRVYRNGNIFVSNKLIFSWHKLVTFAIKLTRSILVATCDGCIAIITTNLENNKIIALYDTKATLIGVELAQNSQKQDNYTIIVVTATGFLVTLSAYLGLIELKKISQSPLICCSISYTRQVGYKILALDCTGVLINQNGKKLNSTQVKDSHWIGTSKSTKQFLLLSSKNELFLGKFTSANVTLNKDEEEEKRECADRQIRNPISIYASHR